MKYEIEIDDALVPEGVLPRRFAKPSDGDLILGAYGQLVVTYPGNNDVRPTLIFERVHVPKIPDFVPEGWWIGPYENGVLISSEELVWLGGNWGAKDEAKFEYLIHVSFDRDALFGDLPPEQCCFQQKGN